MKEFFCGDIVQGCKASFQAADETGILQAVAEHAHNDHGMTEIPAALVDQVRVLIRETASA